VRCRIYRFFERSLAELQNSHIVHHPLSTAISAACGIGNQLQKRSTIGRAAVRYLPAHRERWSLKPVRKSTCGRSASSSFTRPSDLRQAENRCRYLPHC
jgi:hypothetical protein